MKIKWISATSFSLMSLCLAALGFGSCQSKKFLQQQGAQREELHRQLAQIDNEQAASTARMAQLRNDYENIGRGECVYGGPNNMEEARRAMEERQAEQRREVQKKMEREDAILDSLNDERAKVTKKLGELEGKSKRK